MMFPSEIEDFYKRSPEDIGKRQDPSLGEDASVEKVPQSQAVKESDRERFIRWQKLAIDQLGYTLNFVLTLTIASLGYIFSLLKDKDFNPDMSARHWLLTSLILLEVAAVAGVACIINRLHDIQSTARHIRDKVKAPSSEELQVMGFRTWILFYIQFAGFSIGIACLAIAMLLFYGSKKL